MARIVLAMSGGVDSSVAAHLLRRDGHEVIGVFMRHGEAPAARALTRGQGSKSRGQGSGVGGQGSDLQPAACGLEPSALPIVQRTDHKQGCCTAADAADARRIADQMDIPFYAIDLQADFGRIIDYFIEEYEAARTPNPCVMCNTWIKFGRLFDYADSVGAEFVATGHYARIVADANGAPTLARGLDASKDQSYALFGIDRRMLGRMMLPVGEYRKTAIRTLARELGLAVADKRDSQEICFVPAGDHAAFIRAKRGPSETAGQIVTSDGTVVGEHDGLERFTIGQRKGLGVALGEPRFVVRLERETGRVVLGTKDELAREALTADRTNWLVDRPTQPLRSTVKIRYNAPPVAATIEPLEHDRLRVVFDQPQHGVAPGQAVVCYDGELVLGGGWIESRTD